MAAVPEDGAALVAGVVDTVAEIEGLTVTVCVMVSLDMPLRAASVTV